MQIIERMFIVAVEAFGLETVAKELGATVQSCEIVGSDGLTIKEKKDRISVTGHGMTYEVWGIHKSLTKLTALLNDHFGVLTNKLTPASPISHFIDFEASGLHPDSYPIEIGVAHPSGTYQALIKPERHWEHWSYDAEDMHQISRDQLIAGGKPALQVAQDLNDLFSNQMLVSDASADSYWLEAPYDAAGIDPTFRIRSIDSVVDPEHAAAIYYQMPAARAHRALPDAIALAHTVEKHFQLMRRIDYV